MNKYADAAGHEIIYVAAANRSPLLARDRHQSPVLHNKQMPSSGAGEYATTPRNMRLNGPNGGGGNVRPSNNTRKQFTGNPGHGPPGGPVYGGDEGYHEYPVHGLPGVNCEPGVQGGQCGDCDNTVNKTVQQSVRSSNV